MKTTKFKSNVIKVKSRGTCFIQIPKHLVKNYSEKEEIKVSIDNAVMFFCNVRLWKGLGFYVPAKIALTHQLINKKVRVGMQRIKGFSAKIMSDGRVYIPKHVAQQNNLRQNDIILLECKSKDRTQKTHCKVHVREKKKTKEYFCMFTRKRSEKIEGVFEIKKLFPSKTRIGDFTLSKLLTFDSVTQIQNKSILIYHGNRVPIIINSGVSIENLAYYLGCYFADGTKKGNSWGICASTFEQAIYYKEMHEKIIRDKKTSYRISYSDPKNKNKEILKNKLRDIWQKNTVINLNDVSVVIYSTHHKNAPNRNKYGTLIFTECRELTRIYYVRLLTYLINKIKKENNQNLALDFILGVLEGDGSPGPEKRGHLIIATNLDDSKILGKILSVAKLKYKVRKEGENKYIIHVGSLEIINNISILKDKLFKYYPKRRKILKERLAQTGCSRFLLGKSKKTSNWLIGQLNDYGILDGKGNLTKKGNKIKRDLKEFLTTK